MVVEWCKIVVLLLAIAPLLLARFLRLLWFGFSKLLFASYASKTKNKSSSVDGQESATKFRLEVGLGFYGMTLTVPWRSNSGGLGR